MIKIEWMFGFGNTPRIVLEEDLDLLPREDLEFEHKDGLWWAIQPNGLVRYFAHSGRDVNEGGFGGSSFDIMHKGQRKTLKGPWSSRAACVNMMLPADKQIADITLYNRNRHPISIGILASELVNRWSDVDAFLIRALRNNPEQGPLTASTVYNGLKKPDGQDFGSSSDIDYEIFCNPFNGEK